MAPGSGYTNGPPPAARRRRKPGGAVWIGIDTGGTFTDIVLVDLEAGSFAWHKLPTTPSDPSRAIEEGVAQILAACAIGADRVTFLAHGTTRATNAVLEGKCAATGMITTAGFRDVLAIARQRRPHLFNLKIDKPKPPVSRDLRIEVDERVAADGTVVTPLRAEEVERTAARLREAGVEAVAICFLHAYANGAHEEAARRAVVRAWPEAFVCTSAEISNEFREFDRFATTAINASLMPVMTRYLSGMGSRIARLGIRVGPRIMQSNGGVASAEWVRTRPVNTFLSGPAAGVIGSVAIGARSGRRDLITFDMGGTSTDVCLIRGGVPATRKQHEIGGFPVRVAALDVHTVGAGGGSIAWVDAGGLPKVGPQSAGAEPGPAAYDRGGFLPTVTDANIVLGRLSPVSLLGGRMPVRPDLAREAVVRGFAERLSLDPVGAAAGIVRIANANMMGAVRVISVERGEDPRGFAMLAFGGAGPLHAAEVAQGLGMATVLVPPRPGLLSALGLLYADLRGTFSLTHLVPAVPASLRSLQDGVSDLRQKAERWLEDEGAATLRARFEWYCDMRYHGQSFELPVPLPDGRLDEGALQTLLAGFHRAHAAAYGYDLPDRRTEIVHLRLVVTANRPQLPVAGDGADAGKPGEARSMRRPVWFRDGGFVDTPIHARDRLAPGSIFSGPAVVEQMDATTVVPPGARAEVDEQGNLLLHLESAAGGSGEAA